MSTACDSPPCALCTVVTHASSSASICNHDLSVCVIICQNVKLKGTTCDSPPRLVHRCDPRQVQRIHLRMDIMR